jgi:protoporphyrinogen oxidase
MGRETPRFGGRKMKIAIIGAGYGGLAAAYDFLEAGHQVSIYESADYAGGLAAGFKEPHWNSYVERYYHHWFQSDSAMIGLIKDLGWLDKMLYTRPQTVVYHNEKFYPLDSPLAALSFPGYGFFDMVRFGFVTLYLKLTSNWKALEKVYADEWLRRFYGEKVYAKLFEPLLVGKFGEHAARVNMAWFWARTKARTTRLGTYKGGFQAFTDALVDHLRSKGANIYLSTPVNRISTDPQGGLIIDTPTGVEHFDQCLSTTSPSLMARLAPDLPQTYLKGLLELQSMGAVVIILSIKEQLSKEGYYWYNIPKSAGFPFLILVEHTNFVPAEQYGGEHIIYIGDYLNTDHEYFTLSKEELLERFLPSLTRINPNFSPEWVNKSWLFKTNYAQPIPLLNHSKNIPAVKTPIPSLYYASMSQVYPWDRGTNFAVELGRKTARLMLSDSGNSFGT